MSDKLDGSERRKKILELLEQTPAAISGSSMAKRLGVSRQIIVQDIALLRASNLDILSTPRGYLLHHPPMGSFSRRYQVSHTSSQIEQELNLMVDLGGRVLDVIVEHPVYGEIHGTLNLSSRRDVQDFIKKIHTQKGTPLLEISRGIHMHTVEAAHEEILDEIEQELQNAGILIK